MKPDEEDDDDDDHSPGGEEDGEEGMVSVLTISNRGLQLKQNVAF